MASAIGIALISSILPPMAAKAIDIIKGKAKDKAKDKAMDIKGLKIVKIIANKTVDKEIVNIQRDISKLQKTLDMIQGIVQVAEEKQIDKQGKPTVFIQKWLSNLVDISYEARDVLDDLITFSSCVITAEEASNPVNFMSSLRMKYFGNSSSGTSNIAPANLNRLAKHIRSVRERFDEMKEEGKTFATLKSVVGGGSESVSVDRRPEVRPSINEQRDALFLGRGEEKEGIIKKILHPSDDNRVDVVAIWGMGGIGKTTLVQSIYNDERVNEDDYPTKNRSWLCVGGNKFSAEKVIREIVKDHDTTDIGNLLEKLVKKFMGNRFLIVLDDVWDVDGGEWDLLFNPLTNVGKGGLIIITTRRREVCTVTNTQTTYDLKPLSEDDSWSIFESCAYVNGRSDTTPELKRIGEEIVKKLNGLPFALKVVGRSLLNQDYSTWKNFLESKLPKDDEVMSTLRQSYNHLRQHLKMCFTCCALFPKDHFFDEKLLVQMWMAHDLIQKKEQTRPEDVGAQYFEELVNASLLQCVDGKYTMHGLIHNLALLVSKEEFAIANSSPDQMEKVRHITITPGDYSKIPGLCKMEKLLTLYTISSDEKYTKCLDVGDLDGVFKQMKSTRVMVLSSYGIIEILNCTSELKHLRYLDVSKTNVRRLPDSLCHLYNLQMLAAPCTAELPTDIVNISSLRYVRANLSTCKGVGKLTSLQELSSICVCKDDNIRELGDMQRLRGKLTIKGLENVEKLEDAAGFFMEKQTLMDELVLKFDKQLDKSTIYEKVLDALGCPPNLTYLQISGYTGVKSSSWMVDGKHKFDKLQTLELSNCPKLESLPPLGELNLLKHLCLRSIHKVKRLGDEFYGKWIVRKVLFPSLETLYLNDMKICMGWDDIIINDTSASFFPCLTRLRIHECPELSSALPLVVMHNWKDKHTIMNALNFMKSLSHLEIRNCHRLVVLHLDVLVSLKSLEIHCNGLETLKITSCEHLEMMEFERLPSLKTLDIRSCYKLISIPRLVGIKCLYLYGCESLRSLSIDIHGLNSLERLEIFHCPILELIFEDGPSSSSCSTNLAAVPLQNLQRIGTNDKHIFTKLFHQDPICLEYLHIEYFSKKEENNLCKLTSLKSLHISSCEDLKSLPSEFNKLSSLNSLKIEYCPKLQSLPPDFHKHPSLNSLYINCCPQLRSLPALGLPRSLKSLDILICPLLYERCKDESGRDWHKIKHILKITIFGEHKVHRYGP